VGKDVVRDHEIGSPAHSYIGTKPSTEKRLNHWNAPGLSSSRRAVGGLDPEAGDASLMHVLKKVTVVCRDFDHVALRSELKSLHDLVYVPLHMFEPRLRIATEIRVIGPKEFLTADKVFGLD
jgi:hypothetical protein